MRPTVQAHGELPRSGFDKLASVYRWLEYASFGPLLQRTRVQFLAEGASGKKALVLGDGDGRFCVQLLRVAKQAQVVALDASAAMLARLQRRAVNAGIGDRLQTVHGDAMDQLPAGDFDLVCTHFFLDCLSDAEVEALASRLRWQCPGATWLVSEFAVPPQGAMRGPAWIVVRLLYAVFGVLTGLRNQRLPDHAAALRRNGWRLQRSHTRAGGLLRSELWEGLAALPAAVHPTQEEGEHG